MRLIRNKNVIEFNDGTKYKVNSPFVNDILNYPFNDLVKYDILDRKQKYYEKRYERLGGKVENYSKEEFFASFGSLLSIINFTIISDLTDTIIPAIGASIAITLPLIYAMYKYALKKDYVFVDFEDHSIHKHMGDFDVAKKYLKSKDDSEIQL